LLHCAHRPFAADIQRRRGVRKQHNSPQGQQRQAAQPSGQGLTHHVTTKESIEYGKNGTHPRRSDLTDLSPMLFLWLARESCRNFCPSADDRLQTVRPVEPPESNGAGTRCALAAAAAGVSPLPTTAWAITSCMWVTGTTSTPSSVSAPNASCQFSFGIMTLRAPASRAASTLATIPPTGFTRPRIDTSPVIATLLSTGKPVTAE